MFDAEVAAEEQRLAFGDVELVRVQLSIEPDADHAAVVVPERVLHVVALSGRNRARVVLERAQHDDVAIEDKLLAVVIIGDGGRRGRLQNLEFGPTPPTDDDQLSGPEPDDAHLTGVVLRLNDDGSTPRDNPLMRVTRKMTAIAGLAGALASLHTSLGSRTPTGNFVAFVRPRRVMSAA